MLPLKTKTVLLMPLLMCGCASTQQIADSSCHTFRPIHWSKKDTAQTKREVVTHNRKFDAICTGGLT